MRHFVEFSGTHSVPVSVRVHYATVLMEACDIINHRLDVPSDARLDEKGRMVCDERNHRHGSIGTDILAEQPTKDQLLAIAIVRRIRELVERFNVEDEAARKK